MKEDIPKFYRNFAFLDNPERLVLIRYRYHQNRMLAYYAIDRQSSPDFRQKLLHGVVGAGLYYQHISSSNPYGRSLLAATNFTLSKKESGQTQFIV